MNPIGIFAFAFIAFIGAVIIASHLRERRQRRLGLKNTCVTVSLEKTMKYMHIPIPCVAYAVFYMTADSAIQENIFLFLLLIVSCSLFCLTILASVVLGALITLRYVEQKCPSCGGSAEIYPRRRGVSIYCATCTKRHFLGGFLHNRWIQSGD
jgi:hypothetical protein